MSRVAAKAIVAIASCELGGTVNVSILAAGAAMFLYQVAVCDDVILAFPDCGETGRG